MWSIWNEPNQPQFLQPQYGRGQRPVSPRHLPRALYKAGYAGVRATAANAARQDPDRRDLAARQPQGRRPARLPARHAVPELAATTSGGGARSSPADGYAHHAYTTSAGPRFRPPNPDDVTIGVLSRLVRALDRAGRAGALPRAPADLPDRVRHPELPRPHTRRLAGPPGRVPGHLRAHRLRQPARRAVLAVPDARRPAAHARLPLQRLRERAADVAAARRSPPTTASGCRSRSSAPAARTSCGGWCGPTAPSTKVTIHAALRAQALSGS